MGLSYAHASQVFEELRKEILEGQKIRTQLVGFKITIVSTGVALILADTDGLPVQLLVIPALTAMFFDIMINSYSLGIKRIGYYILTILDPLMRATGKWPGDKKTWEEFNSMPYSAERSALGGTKGTLAREAAVFPSSSAAAVPEASLRYQRDVYSMVGNLGLTVLAAMAGAISLFFPFRGWVSLPVLVLLISLLSYDVWSSLAPARVKKEMARVLSETDEPLG